MKFTTISGAEITAELANQIISRSAKILTLSQLKRLCGRRSRLALDCLTGKAPQTVEDLTSETKTFLFDALFDGQIYFSDLLLSPEMHERETAEALSLIFTNDETKLDAFRTVDNCFYPFRKAKYKEIDFSNLNVNRNIYQIIDYTQTAEGEIFIDDFRARLGERQTIVFEMLREGYTAKEISDKLNVTRRTVSRYILSLRKRLEKYFKIL